LTKSIDRNSGCLYNNNNLSIYNKNKEVSQGITPVALGLASAKLMGAFPLRPVRLFISRHSLTGGRSVSQTRQLSGDNFLIMKLMNPPVGVSSLRLEIEKIAGQRDQKTLNVVRVEELKKNAQVFCRQMN
jgi:hypothetical protein